MYNSDESWSRRHVGLIQWFTAYSGQTRIVWAVTAVHVQQYSCTVQRYPLYPPLFFKYKYIKLNLSILLAFSSLSTSITSLAASLSLAGISKLLEATEVSGGPTEVEVDEVGDDDVDGADVEE